MTALAKPTMRAHYYGHEIVSHLEVVCEGKSGFFSWNYVDTGEDIKIAPARPCPSCNLLPTAEGHDPCIPNLPGIKFACCGHGITDGYLSFEDGTIVRGKFTVERK